MPTLPSQFRPKGQLAPPDARRETDRQRGSARARGYTPDWERARAHHLALHPLCVYCAMGAWGAPPRVSSATTVDHLIPHKGSKTIFWRRVDWISACAPCHDGPKQAIERRPLDLAALANAVRAFVASTGG